MLIFLFLLRCIVGGQLFAYFSDQIKRESVIGTGSASISIQDLSVGGSPVGQPSQAVPLSANTSSFFSFTIKNTGLSALEYTLSLEAAWHDDTLNEAGKILVYPLDYSDGVIYEYASAGNFLGALIGGDTDDNNVLQTSDGVKHGINEIIDFTMIEAGDEKSYAYKLFFYEDAHVFANAALYNNKNLELRLIVDADIVGRETGWAMQRAAAFNMVTEVDSSVPVITEVKPLPKTFFAEQAESIDLRDYAVAYDETDGDITDKIIISSVPAFNPNAAGTYQITYNVKNSRGKAAAELTVEITVWNFVKTAHGNNHSLALTSHGKVYTWGQNNSGQLGDGGNTSRSTPAIVDRLDNIIDIAACNSSSYALAADGQLYAWGHNGYGHLGTGNTTASKVPVAVAQPEGVKFVQVNSRFNTAGALTAEGDVYTWGYGGYGASGNGIDSEINNIPQKINLTDVVRLEFGSYNGAAITRDGKLYVWGDNLDGQIGNGSWDSTIHSPVLVSYFANNNIKVSDISVGGIHLAAVTEDGRLFTWGNGSDYRLGNGQTGNRYTPGHIALPSAAKEAVAGYDHSGVLTTDGSVYLFGNNSYGKLGTGDTVRLARPTLLDGVTDATYFSLSPDASFIISQGKTLYAMGNGAYGMLGTGNTNGSTVPVKWVFTPPPPF